MNPIDPLCFECQGAVEVVDTADSLLTAYCPTCDHWFGVEVEHRPDGKAVYWPMYRVAPDGGNTP